MAKCHACGARLSADVDRLVGRVLASMNDQQRAALAETYQGKPPQHLCARCTNATIGPINNMVRGQHGN